MTFIQDRPDLAVGRGWYAIVDQTTAQLKELDPDFKIIQIKEKFGGLRYYYQPKKTNASTRVQMDAVIARAERAAEETCEDCGAAGRTRSKKTGWLITLCDDCAEKMGPFRED